MFEQRNWAGKEKEKVIRTHTTGGRCKERKGPDKESKEEGSMMWEDNTMYIFEDHMTLSILNFMVFHKENYAFCWSIIQTNVNIMVEILCYKTYIY